MCVGVCIYVCVCRCVAGYVLELSETSILPLLPAVFRGQTFPGRKGWQPLVKPPGPCSRALPRRHLALLRNPRLYTG